MVRSGRLQKLMGDASGQIVQVLNQALDSNPGVRRQGEALLESLASHQGFGLALLHAALRQVSSYMASLHCLRTRNAENYIT